MRRATMICCLWIAGCAAPKSVAATASATGPEPAEPASRFVLSAASQAWLAERASAGRLADPSHNEFPATGSGLLDSDGMPINGGGGGEYWALVFHDGTSHFGDLLGTSGQPDVPALAGYKYGHRWAPGVGAFPPTFFIEPVNKLGLPNTNVHPDLSITRDQAVLSATWNVLSWERAAVNPAPASVTVAASEKLFRLDFADGEIGYLLVSGSPDRLEWFLTPPRWWPGPGPNSLHDIRVPAVATQVPGPVTLTGTYFHRVDDQM